MKSNACNEATAPTACTSSLIDRKTHYRSLKIPVVWRKCNVNTTNAVISNAIDSNYLHNYWKKICLFLMDEDSMVGRPFWAWFKRRVEEARSSSNENEITLDELNNDYLFNPDVYERTWGGTHIVYSCCDWYSLPPVGMPYISDLNSRPAIHISDMQGLFSFKWFLNCTEDGTRSCVSVMDEVIRQADVTFKNVSHNIREGTLNDVSDNLSKKRCV